MTHTSSTEHQHSGTKSKSQDASMQDCIASCLECSEVCNETLTHCLSMGGKHVEPNHIKTLIACADICALSAQWMIRDIEFHSELCRTCAEVCKACAASCKSVGADEAMQNCIDVCTACAKMASH